LAGAAPAFAAVFEDERLSDEATCEIGRRAADAKNVGSEALIIGRVADFFQPGDELVTEHGDILRRPAKLWRSTATYGLPNKAVDERRPTALGRTGEIVPQMILLWRQIHAPAGRAVQ
jgi:hypothetical protein